MDADKVFRDVEQGLEPGHPNHARLARAIIEAKGDADLALNLYVRDIIDEHAEAERAGLIGKVRRSFNWAAHKALTIIGVSILLFSIGATAFALLQAFE